MRRTRNPSIYTGRVGAKMRAPLPRVNRRIARKTYRCVGGPLDGRSIRLDPTGDLRTLPFVTHGHAGHYKNGGWVPAQQGVPAPA